MTEHEFRCKSYNSKRLASESYACICNNKLPLENEN